MQELQGKTNLATLAFKNWSLMVIIIIIIISWLQWSGTVPLSSFTLSRFAFTSWNHHRSVLLEPEWIRHGLWSHCSNAEIFPHPKLQKGKITGSHVGFSGFQKQKNTNNNKSNIEKGLFPQPWMLLNLHLVDYLQAQATRIRSRPCRRWLSTWNP